MRKSRQEHKGHVSCHWSVAVAGQCGHRSQRVFDGMGKLFPPSSVCGFLEASSHRLIDKHLLGVVVKTFA